MKKRPNPYKQLAPHNHIGNEWKIHLTIWNRRRNQLKNSNEKLIRQRKRNKKKNSYVSSSQKPYTDTPKNEWNAKKEEEKKRNTTIYKGPELWNCNSISLHWFLFVLIPCKRTVCCMWENVLFHLCMEPALTRLACERRRKTTISIWMEWDNVMKIVRKNEFRS